MFIFYSKEAYSALPENFTTPWNRILASPTHLYYCRKRNVVNYRWTI